MILLKLYLHFSFKGSITSSNPLYDGHDYTFLDGRPTPLGNKKRLRYKDQLAICVSMNISIMMIYPSHFPFGLPQICQPIRTTLHTQFLSQHMSRTNYELDKLIFNLQSLWRNPKLCSILQVKWGQDHPYNLQVLLPESLPSFLSCIYLQLQSPIRTKFQGF